MDNPRQTLSKEERLSGKTAVSSLMAKGKWSHSEHFKTCIAENGITEFNRILVSVPKRYFKRAVKRNLLKRRIREAYRRNKTATMKKGLDIMFFYNFNELLPFPEIEAEIVGILQAL